MYAEPEELACPVLRKLVDLLEADRRLGDRQPSAFLLKLAEIERDASRLDTAPGTRALIQVARDVMTFSQTVVSRTAAA